MSGTYYRSSRVISKNNARNYLSSNVKIPAPIEYIASEAFQKKTKISSVCFPDTLKNIGARTFQGCTLLKEVLLPTQVENMGSNVFSQCNSLKKVILPQALSSIPRAAFQENRKLGCVIFPMIHRFPGSAPKLFHSVPPWNPFSCLPHLPSSKTVLFTAVKISVPWISRKV